MTTRSLQATVAAVLLAGLLAQPGEAASPPPALYTQAQARQGHRVFEQKCAACHGHRLEGRVGPALKGPTFASVKSGFTIQQIYEFLSVEMPAYAPGSLSPQQYLEITAFLLQENGYPAGAAPLTNEVASASSVALVYRPPGKASSPLAKTAAPAGKSPEPNRPPAQRQPPCGKPMAASLAASMADTQ